jgi:hypothetical protein
MELHHIDHRAGYIEILHVRRNILENVCKRYFAGNIIVDGVPLGRGTSINSFLKKSNIEWMNKPFPLLYKYYLSCSNQIYNDMVYITRVSENNKTDIEEFKVSLNR